MSLSYSKLFNKLNEKGIKKYHLRRDYGIHAKTVESFTHNKSVTLDTLCQLCKILNCNIGDLVDYIPDDKD